MASNHVLSIAIGPVHWAACLFDVDKQQILLWERYGTPGAALMASESPEGTVNRPEAFDTFRQTIDMLLCKVQHMIPKPGDAIAGNGGANKAQFCVLIEQQPVEHGTLNPTDLGSAIVQDILAARVCASPIGSKTIKFATVGKRYTMQGRGGEEALPGSDDKAGIVPRVGHWLKSGCENADTIKVTAYAQGQWEHYMLYFDSGKLDELAGSFAQIVPLYYATWADANARIKMN